MRKKYYIVTANSSEPEISHPKNNPNTLIFAKARCRWDYAEKISGCNDCLEEKRLNGKVVFKIVNSEFQHGQSNKLLRFLFLISLICLNIIVLVSIAGNDLFHLFGPIYEMSGNIATISGLILSIFNVHSIRKKLTQMLTFGTVANKFYLILIAILISFLLSAFLWKFKILQFSNAILGLIIFVLSWALF